MSITYLVFDIESGDILGYFTLTHKVLYILAEGLSNTVKRRLDRYGNFDKDTNSYLMRHSLLHSSERTLRSMKRTVLRVRI